MSQSRITNSGFKPINHYDNAYLKNWINVLGNFGSSAAKGYFKTGGEAWTVSEVNRTHRNGNSVGLDMLLTPKPVYNDTISFSLCKNRYDDDYQYLLFGMTMPSTRMVKDYNELYPKDLDQELHQNQNYTNELPNYFLKDGWVVGICYGSRGGVGGGMSYNQSLRMVTEPNAGFYIYRCEYNSDDTNTVKTHKFIPFKDTSGKFTDNIHLVNYTVSYGENGLHLFADGEHIGGVDTNSTGEDFPVGKFGFGVQSEQMLVKNIVFNSLDYSKLSNVDNITTKYGNKYDTPKWKLLSTQLTKVYGDSTVINNLSQTIGSEVVRAPNDDMLTIVRSFINDTLTFDGIVGANSAANISDNNVVKYTKVYDNNDTVTVDLFIEASTDNAVSPPDWKLRVVLARTVTVGVTGFKHTSTTQSTHTPIDDGDIDYDITNSKMNFNSPNTFQIGSSTVDESVFDRDDESHSIVTQSVGVFDETHSNRVASTLPHSVEMGLYRDFLVDINIDNTAYSDGTNTKFLVNNSTVVSYYGVNSSQSLSTLVSNGVANWSDVNAIVVASRGSEYVGARKPTLSQRSHNKIQVWNFKAGLDVLGGSGSFDFSGLFDQTTGSFNSGNSICHELSPTLPFTSYTVEYGNAKIVIITNVGESFTITPANLGKSSFGSGGFGYGIVGTEKCKLTISGVQRYVSDDVFALIARTQANFTPTPNYNPLSENLTQFDTKTNSYYANKTASKYKVNWQQVGNMAFTDGNAHHGEAPTLFGTNSQQIDFTTKINCSWGGYNGMYGMYFGMQPITKNGNIVNYNGFFLGFTTRSSSYISVVKVDGAFNFDDDNKNDFWDTADAINLSYPFKNCIDQSTNPADVIYRDTLPINNIATYWGNEDGKFRSSGSGGADFHTNSKTTYHGIDVQLTYTKDLIDVRIVGQQRLTFTPTDFEMEEFPSGTLGFWQRGCKVTFTSENINNVGKSLATVSTTTNKVISNVKSVFNTYDEIVIDSIDLSTNAIQTVIKSNNMIPNDILKPTITSQPNENFKVHFQPRYETVEDGVITYRSQTYSSQIDINSTTANYKSDKMYLDIVVERLFTLDTQPAGDLDFEIALIDTLGNKFVYNYKFSEELVVVVDPEPVDPDEPDEPDVPTPPVITTPIDDIVSTDTDCNYRVTDDYQPRVSDMDLNNFKLTEDTKIGACCIVFDTDTSFSSLLTTVEDNLNTESTEQFDEDGSPLYNHSLMYDNIDTNINEDQLKDFDELDELKILSVVSDERGTIVQSNEDAFVLQIEQDMSNKLHKVKNADGSCVGGVYDSNDFIRKNPYDVGGSFGAKGKVSSIAQIGKFAIMLGGNIEQGNSSTISDNIVPETLTIGFNNSVDDTFYNDYFKSIENEDFNHVTQTVSTESLKSLTGIQWGYLSESDIGIANYDFETGELISDGTKTKSYQNNDYDIDLTHVGDVVNINNTRKYVKMGATNNNVWLSYRTGYNYTGTKTVTEDNKLSSTVVSEVGKNEIPIANQFEHIEIVNHIKRSSGSSDNSVQSGHKSNIYSIVIKDSGLNDNVPNSVDKLKIQHGVESVIKTMLDKVAPAHTMLWKIEWQGK